MSMFLKNSIMNPPKSGNFFICDMTAKRLICWFSCGAASAVATYLALKKNRQTKQFDEVKVVYTHVQEEHPDNYRFFCDCEKLLEIKRAKERERFRKYREKYKDQIKELQRKRYQKRKQMFKAKRGE